MGYVRRLFLATVFIASIGFIPIVAWIQARPAYGYSEADVRKLLETNQCPGCDLSNADISDGGLDDANLSGANLSGAKLKSTSFRSTDLSGANLSGANLTGAKVRGTNFVGAIGLSKEQKEDLQKRGAKVD